MSTETSLIKEAAQPQHDCSWRYVLPVRFALCTYSPCELPFSLNAGGPKEGDQITLSSHPEWGNTAPPRKKTPVGVAQWLSDEPEIQAEKHRYTLRTLDSGYVFVTWLGVEGINEEMIGVFQVSKGQLKSLTPNFFCSSDAIKVPKKVKAVYLLFIRIPDVAEEFLEGRTTQPWEDMRKHIAKDPTAYMQRIELGIEGDGPHGYSYGHSPLCFHMRDLPHHVEEYSLSPGCLLSLKHTSVGKNLFALRLNLPDQHKWPVENLCSELTNVERWSASMVPYQRATVNVHCADSHVACLVDPVGAVHDMVSVYDKSLQDISMFNLWHEPMHMSGQLLEIWINVLKSQGDSSDTLNKEYTQYQRFLAYQSIARDAMENFLTMVKSDWANLLAANDPLVSFQFMLGELFASDDQQQPSSVTPEKGITGDEKLADPLTVARLSVLACSFLHIANRSDSYATMDELFSGSFLELVEKLIREGGVPGEEYPLITLALTSYITDRAKLDSTIATRLLSALNKRLGLPDAAPTKTLYAGMNTAQTWINGEYIPPLGSLEAQITNSQAVFDTLYRTNTMYSLPSEVILRKEWDLLHDAKNNADKIETLVRDAEAVLAKSQMDLNTAYADHYNAKMELLAAHGKLEDARRRYWLTNEQLDVAVKEHQREIDLAKAKVDDAQKRFDIAKEKFDLASKDPLGNGKSLTNMKRDLGNARKMLESARRQFTKQYELHIGALGKRIAVSDLQAAKASDVRKVQAAIDSLRDSFEGSVDQLRLMYQLEEQAKARVSEAARYWNMENALYNIYSSDVERGRADLASATDAVNAQNKRTIHLQNATHVLDGAFSSVNLVMSVHRILNVKKGDEVSVYVREFFVSSSDALVLLNIALERGYGKWLPAVLRRIACQSARIAVVFTLVVDIFDSVELMRHKDYDAAAVTLGSGVLLATMSVVLAGSLKGAGASAAAGTVSGGTTLIATAVFLLVAAGAAVAIFMLKDSALERAAKNNYWTSYFFGDSPREEIDLIPFQKLASPFAAKPWREYWSSLYEDVSDVYSPTVELSVSPENNLVVSTNFVQSVVVGQPVLALYTMDGETTTDISPACMVKEPQVTQEGGRHIVRLEFDLAKIMKEAKGVSRALLAGSSYTGAGAHIPEDFAYTMHIRGAVFHKVNTSMGVTKNESERFRIYTKRKITDPEFSAKDITEVYHGGTTYFLDFTDSLSRSSVLMP